MLTTMFPWTMKFLFLISGDSILVQLDNDDEDKCNKEAENLTSNLGRHRGKLN